MKKKLFLRNHIDISILFLVKLGNLLSISRPKKHAFFLFSNWSEPNDKKGKKNQQLQIPGY